MSSEAETFLQLDDGQNPTRSSRPLWNLLSLLLPAFGWFLGWSYLNGAPRGNFSLVNGSMGATGLLMVAFLVALPLGVIGFVCSFIALVRHERLVPLTVLGLFINLLPLALVLLITLTLF